MIRSPRLLDADFRESAVLPPVAYSLTDKLTPLSMASLTLPCDAPEVPVRSFVELFTTAGSAGIFRVTNLRTTPGEVRELTLQHGLCTLSDHMHRGESTQTGSLRTLLTKLLSNQTDWALGTVDVPDDEDLTWECSNTNDLQGLLSIMQKLPGYYLDFDQTARPWLLHVRARSTVVECEARFDRNITQAQIEYDTTDMCTLAYADGLDAPIVADTTDTWGLIERHVSADEALGQDIITATVQRYLEQRKDPRLTITITAMELSQLTGEPFDSFRKGQLCRCILPDMTAVQRIEAIEHPDPIGEPEHVVLTLASTQDDLSVTVAGMVVDIRHVNQLYQQLDRNLRIEAETIDMIAQQLHLYAYQSEVDGLSTRVNTVEVDLDAAEATLLLKAEQSVVDAQGKRLSTAEADIDGLNGQIALLATKNEVSNVSAILSTVQADLDAAEAAITLKADQSVTDELTTRVNTAEADINAAEAAIALKASQTTVDEQRELISTVQADLDAAEAAITLKASQSNLDSVSLRLDGAEDSITAQASTINLKADKTYVDNLVANYVKTAELEAKVLTVVDSAYIAGALESEDVYALSLSGNRGSFNQVAIEDYLTLGGVLLGTNTLTMGGIASASVWMPDAVDLSHSHVITDNGDGTFTLGEVATTGGSFNIADTKTYQDGVSAAKSEGVNSVTLSGDRWEGGRYAVIASNGKSFSVELPPFSASGGDSFNADHKTTVYFYTDSVSGPLKSVVVDASSVFDEGFGVGYAAASPASVSRVATYDDASKSYSVTIAVKAADGTSDSFDLVAIDASAAYDAGYQAALDSMWLDAAITSVSNMAANTFYAQGYARMYSGEIQLASVPLYKSQIINVGQ